MRNGTSLAAFFGADSTIRAGSVDKTDHRTGELLRLILRDEEKVIPKGGTLLCENDSLILSAIGDPGHQRDIRLTELEIDKNHEWCNTRISDITLPDTVIVLIRRKNRSIIPTGSTVIKENDAVVVINAK